MSAGPKFISFFSDAGDLVSNDRNGARDVFVRDRICSARPPVTFILASSQASTPNQSLGRNTAISDDGTSIAFYSEATDLVPHDLNELSDVFLYSIERRDAMCEPRGTTILVSATPDGMHSGDGPSVFPDMDALGKFVVFQSLATNLVSGSACRSPNVFVRDIGSARSACLCEDLGPGEFCINPSISADGNHIAFVSGSSTLIPGGGNERLQVLVAPNPFGDQGGQGFEAVSVSSEGHLGNGDSIFPALSSDGRYVAFKSPASNLVPADHNGIEDIFVRDRRLGMTERVSVSFLGGDANDVPFPPSISGDGRFVAFGSAASNLVSQDANGVASVFVRDRLLGQTMLVDVVTDPSGRTMQADAPPPDARLAISRDGKCIAFPSLASNLVPDDYNESVDVFVTNNPLFPATTSARDDTND